MISMLSSKGDRDLIPLSIWFAPIELSDIFKEIFASTVVVDLIMQLEKDIM